MKSKFFCYELYKNLAVYSFNGKIRYSPCSFWSGDFIGESDNIDIDTVWNSKERANLINCVQDGSPLDGCKACYRLEQQNLNSRRLGSFHQYEDYLKDTSLDDSSPTGIDYTVGNLCNLKCVICNVDNSSSWISDHEKLNGYYNPPHDKKKQVELTDNPTLKNLRLIHFHGNGEPLMMPYHKKLLQKVKEAKGLSDVKVFYNTNGMFTVSSDVLDLWRECQLIELYFSIDDICERFEYQRTNGKWETLLKNIRWFKDNMPNNHLFYINVTYSMLNIYRLNDLIKWKLDSFDTNRLGDKVEIIFQKAVAECEITSLPQAIKNIILEKYIEYPELIDIIKGIPSGPISDTFIKYITKLDTIRGVSLCDIDKEWYDLIMENYPASASAQSR